MRIRSILVAAVMAIASAVFLGPSMAQADDCTGVYSIGMGGFAVNLQGTWENSEYILDAQPVGYDSLDPMGGLQNLDAAIQWHRSECPGDHIKLVGHSEGAAIIHAWVTAHDGFGDINAVLISDPKRVPGPGWGGLSSTPGNWLIGYPLTGVDDWFGDIPVLTICNHDDQVCNTEAGWWGYLFAGAHGRYNFSADAYGEWDSGVWFL